MATICKISQSNGFVLSDFSPENVFKTLSQIESDPSIRGYSFQLLYMVSQRRNIEGWAWSKKAIIKYLGIKEDTYKGIKRLLKQTGYLRLKQTGFKGWMWEWYLGDEARKHNPDINPGMVDQGQLDLGHQEQKNLSTRPVGGKATTGKTTPLRKKPSTRKKELKDPVAARPRNPGQLKFSFEDLTTAFVRKSLQGLIRDAELQNMAIAIHGKMKTLAARTPDHWRNTAKKIARDMIQGSTLASVAGGSYDVGIPDHQPW